MAELFKKTTVIIIALLLFMAAQAAMAAETPAPSKEIRALWVIRTSLTSPESITEMVRRAKSANFNTLIVQVRGRGDAYYQSRWEPRAAEMKDTPDSFDPRYCYSCSCSLKISGNSGREARV